MLLAHLHEPGELAVALTWLVALARARAVPLVLSVRGGAKGESSLQAFPTREGVGGDEEPKEAEVLAAPLREALDALLGAQGWTAAIPETDSEAGRPGAAQEGPEPSSPPAPGEEHESDGTPVPLPVRLAVVRGADPARALVALCERPEITGAVLVHATVEGAQGESTRLRRHLFRDAPCEVSWLRPGESLPEVPCGAVVAMARGPHARAALLLAEDLRRAGRLSELATLHVEPDLGSVTEGLGQRVLARQLQRALGADRDGVVARVVVAEQVHEGLQRAIEQRGVPLVLLGTSKQGALGRRLGGTVALRLLKAFPGPSALVVRAALPLGGRAWRRVEAVLQRVVPQLERDQRIDLVERVQSNSHWDFDFVTLMSLSTAIAAFGLMADAGAVIIGAMLVAPLMTPLLGIGLALVQGNPRLVRSALRSVGLGFVNAFLVGFVLGLLDPNFHVPTAEMLSRGSPGFRDLAVAFVSGLAGAYASSRPSLMAALPGVAIAAALVPPIATAGLALSIGQGSLAGGALLLFGINAVLIVGASALSLAAVGVRFETGRSKVSRWAGLSVVGAALVLSLLVSLRDRLPVVDAVGRAALVEALPEGYRVLSVQWARDHELGRVIRVRIAGSEIPGQDLAQRLRAAWGSGEELQERDLPPLQLEFLLERVAR